MRAGDVRCPLCGTGFRDVAPAFDLGPSPDVRASTTHGRCANGHAMDVRVDARGASVWAGGLAVTSEDLDALRHSLPVRRMP